MFNKRLKIKLLKKLKRKPLQLKIKNDAPNYLNKSINRLLIILMDVFLNKELIRI